MTFLWQHAPICCRIFLYKCSEELNFGRIHFIEIHSELFAQS